MQLKNIEVTDCNRKFDFESLCQTPFSVDELTRLFNIEFFEKVEDGLGPCFHAFADIDGQKIYLRGYDTRSTKGEHTVVVNMQGNNPCPQTTLNNLLIALNLDLKELVWVRDDLSPPRWVLTRQGDDGNEVEIDRFHRESLALWLMDDYTERGHKQCYQVHDTTEWNPR